MRKLFERIIGQRIERHMREVGPDLSPDQYGFRRNRSTVDAILEYKKHIYNITSRSKIAVAVSIDISNAFNIIPWDAINKKWKTKTSQLI